MKTKTASIRLPKEMYEEIDNICDDVGCSRNDWIKDALKDRLREQFNENIPRPDRNPTPKPKTFTCENGNLYENGFLYGSCADYNLKAGQVYDKDDNYLGKIKNKDPKPQTEIIYTDD